ncbi:unnamed protein product [Adineta ricciae]|uniref:Riboflavin transporter n=1 Tax=Adineta ricciae TaxID=249248 RepID=A0A815JTZ0_ADIRI|nr:unnamed protein product [Adineta ricciae]
MASRWAQVTCFILIVIMNLSSWIDIQGIMVELPLIIPLLPEGWALPSSMTICATVAGIAPILVLILRCYQGKRFSEIPFIYIIIIVGIISCCVLAFFWQRTAFIFGSQRSIWLLGGVLTLSTVDCTSSLVYFDYMKRFRASYLTAVFLGEGLTGLIPTLLVLAQGLGSEEVCIPIVNGTGFTAQYTQPRFSVKIFMFCIGGIILSTSLNFSIQSPDSNQPAEVIDRAESMAMIPETKLEKCSSSSSSSQMSYKSYLFQLTLNTIMSAFIYGCLPSLSTYSMLPYGQKAFYYSSILNPLAYPVASLVSIRWVTMSTLATILWSSIGFGLCVFIAIIAWQSPCPWWADTFHGGLIMTGVWFITILIVAYIRIAIGNRIRREWLQESAMFYFGLTVELGSVIGSVPMYILVSVLHLFTERQPCQRYCLK